MGPFVPPGQSPPFEVIDDYHQAAYIIITAALGLVVSLVCFLIRLYVRLMLIPPFARDDWVLLGATVSFPSVQSFISPKSLPASGYSSISIDILRMLTRVWYFDHSPR